MKDGIYPGLSRETYDAEDRLNWSTLKPMGRSPAHCQAALKEKRTEALSLGIAVHVAILEPERFASVAVWTGAVRRGKEWEAFKSTNEGNDILTEDEHATATAMAEAVREDPIAGPLFTGQSELTLLWTEDGVQFKARLDHLSKGIIDLKSCADASPRGFGTAVARYDYLGQAALYQRGLEVLTEKREPFRFVAVEKEAPYAPQVYIVADEFLLMGRTHFRGLLRKYIECRERNEWPAYSATELALRLPPWAYMDDWSVSNGNE